MLWGHPCVILKYFWGYESSKCDISGRWETLNSQHCTVHLLTKFSASDHFQCWVHKFLSFLIAVQLSMHKLELIKESCCMSLTSIITLQILVETKHRMISASALLTRPKIIVWIRDYLYDDRSFWKNPTSLSTESATLNIEGLVNANTHFSIFNLLL